MKVIQGIIIAIIVGLIGFTIYLPISFEYWNANNLYNPGDRIQHRKSGKYYIILEERPARKAYLCSDGFIKVEIKETEIGE